MATITHTDIKSDFTIQLSPPIYLNPIRNMKLLYCQLIYIIQFQT